MISRYTRPELEKHWSDYNRFHTWFRVECSVLEVLATKKVVDKTAVQVIQKKAKIKVDRILEIEAEVKHDVIAFCTSIAEQCGDAGRYFHYGLTSSDVVDTALALLTKESLMLIQSELQHLLKELWKTAVRAKKIPAIGRTHGMFAEPTAFGLRFLGSYSEFLRHYKTLDIAIERVSYGKLSGAVGVYGALSPEVEKAALTKLGLKPEPVSTQILPRDRLAFVMTTIAQIGSSLEKLAVELRHLQRSEVGEVSEAFTVGQKGSSAMPHKRNPISAENLTGCARVLRGYASTALENVALWHERDISHSSAERIILPDATTLLHYMLNRMSSILKGLNFHQDRIQENLNATQGVYFSGHVLLALVKKGWKREDAYKLVQKYAHEALDQRKPFEQKVRKCPVIGKSLSSKELNGIFNMKHLLRNVDEIYGRVQKDASKILKG